MNDINLALETALKIQKVADAAKLAFIDREEAIRGLALGLACGEHVIFLAPPGTAKTAMGDYFAKAFEAEYFYTAFGVETTSDEIVGPTDPMTLANAVWSRKLAGLATCTIGFVDEVGKGSQEVQNMILGLMEERRVSKDVYVPLHMLFSATNETIDENPAFWDRWSIRCKLGYIQEIDKFLEMLVADVDNPPSYPITDEEFKNLRNVTRLIALSPSQEALKIMGELRSTYAINLSKGAGIDANIEPITDRRWRRILTVAAGSALLRGNDTIQPVDLSCAQFMLWHDAEDKEQMASIKKWVSSLTDKEINLFQEKSALLVELERKTKDLPPFADAKDKSLLHYKATELSTSIQKQKGKQWRDLLDRCEALKTNLMSYSLDI